MKMPFLKKVEVQECEESDWPVYLDKEFEKQVVGHVIGNYLPTPICPLFLAIHGRKGEGKTFQIDQICKKYQIEHCFMSGSELAGATEGESIEQLKNLYEKMGACVSDSRPAVIIIDDFHLSIAAAGNEIKHTVNTTILTSFLMNLADDTRCDGARLPIILTGNDFDYLYAPLQRAGRMRFFEWNPDVNIKIKIVEKLYKDIVCPDDYPRIAEFVSEYSKESVSFFKELINSFAVERIYKDITDSPGCTAAEILTKIITLDSSPKKKRSCCIPMSQLRDMAPKFLMSFDVKSHENRSF